VIFQDVVFYLEYSDITLSLEMWIITCCQNTLNFLSFWLENFCVLYPLEKAT
jgi:hypothetical protein